MTQPRPLTAEDYETISFRVPRAIGLSAALRKAAAASGETTTEIFARRLATSLALDFPELRKSLRGRG